MKKCNFCHKLRDFYDFHKNNDYKDGRLSVCKYCCSIKNKKRYRNQNQKDKIILQNYKRRDKLYSKINELKTVPCKDCNNIFLPYCMDFDHIGNKKMAISKMAHECFSFSNILKEIEKTELVCIMCHRLRTFNRRLKNKSKPRNPKSQRNFDYINNIKSSTPCVICNKFYHPCQMDFDHIKSKHKPVSHMAAQRYAIKTIQKEINKCQLLCALCHRKKTFKERGYRT